MGLAPDGDAPSAAAAHPARPAAATGPAALPGALLWRSPRFATLAAATSLGLFAQIGLIAHLFSLLAPALGAHPAGLATACAIAGRTGLGWLLPPTADRRRAAAANYALQLCGSLALAAAGSA